MCRGPRTTHLIVLQGVWTWWITDAETELHTGDTFTDDVHYTVFHFTFLQLSLSLCSSDTRTRSLSLDHTGEDHFLCQGSGPSTPRSHYESRSHSPMGRVNLRPQVSIHLYTLNLPLNKWISQGRYDEVVCFSLSLSISLSVPLSAIQSVCLFIYKCMCMLKTLCV